MNQDIKRQWVEALRSGKYKQGFSLLRQVRQGEDLFCPYGVLCDLFSPKWSFDPKFNTYKYEMSSITPPSRILIWSGLKFSDSEKLIYTLNDSQRLSFEDIAVYIETHL